MSRPPRPKPLVTLRSTFLKVGSRAELRPFRKPPCAQTWPDTTPSLLTGVSHLVYAVPLWKRSVEKMPTFRSSEPTNVPSRQSPGKFMERAPASTCGRLLVVGATACGGGALPPDSAFTTREPKFRYVFGSVPVFLADE